MDSLRPGATRWAPFLAFLCLAALGACSSGGAPLSYEPPPAGVPDTPYWYRIGDSLFWYQPADSHAVVQVKAESTPARRSEALLALRELGWRMAVLRTSGLSRTPDPQELSQTLFAVDRVGEAASYVAQYGKFRRSFWNRSDTTFMGLLPGLIPAGQEQVYYYWPCAVAVVWNPGTREADVRKLADSLGLQIATPQALSQYYWVERTWSLLLPPGSELFTWLRLLNRDPRVQLAHPVQTMREPPMPDQRIIRRFPPRPGGLLPAGVEKFSEALRMSWVISQFCGHTRLVQATSGAQADGERLRVRITLLSAPANFIPSIVAAGGEVIESGPLEVEAWIPYLNLPACAADSRVQKVDEVRENLLGG